MGEWADKKIHRIMHRPSMVFYVSLFFNEKFMEGTEIFMLPIVENDHLIQYKENLVFSG